MPTLTIFNKKLILDVNDQPELSKGGSRVFFSSSMGFDLSENIYSIEIGWQYLSGIIKDVVSYLKEKNIELTLDENCSRILRNSINEDERLRVSIEVGKKLHETTNHIIYINNFVRDLKPYQIESVKHITEVETIANFSVPGSGKTTIVYAAFSILKQKNEVEKLLVIGPRASFMPWEEEYKECFGTRPNSIRITGARIHRRNLYEVCKDKDLILMTYQMATNDVEDVIEVLQNYKIMLVLDESHYVKKFEGGKWSETILALSQFAKRRTILTGTPMPNNLLDLWTQITFLWPEKNLLGEKAWFKYNIESSDIEDIKSKLRPLFCRIKKKDLNLPKPIYVRHKIPMKLYQKNIYDAIETKILSEIIKLPEDRVALREWRRAKIIRLIEAASNPALLNKYSEEFKVPPFNAENLPIHKIIERYPDFEIPSKIEYTDKLARDIIKSNEKVIIWTSFVHNIKMLQNLLKEFNPAVVYGDIPKDENENDIFNREKEIARFKSDPNTKILIANPGACAESISLHKICKNAIYVDRTFNGGQFMQSLDRIHRLGISEDDKITYYLLISSDTIEEVIDDRLETKMGNMLKLMDDDLSVINLDFSLEDVSENEDEENTDFEAVLKYVKNKLGNLHDSVH